MGELDPSRRHRRRSIRLPTYDYARPGAYFVTMCTHRRQLLLGNVVGDEMRLGPLGAIVKTCWDSIPEHFPHVATDAFVVMPNHVHGILVFLDFPGGGMARQDPTPTMRQFSKPEAGALPTVVGSFKSAATRQVNVLRGKPGARLWQRNYYEHVIRSQGALDRIRAYILDNPRRWALDKENPQRSR